MLENETLLADLLKSPSLTPFDAGCTDIITKFFNHKPRFFNAGQTTNALFEFGHGPTALLFVGHTDVVPHGPEEQWHSPPFSYQSKDPIIARGAVDMKGAIWAFCNALKYTLPTLSGKIDILLTSDEEGDGRDGMQYAITQLVEEGYHAKWALVGEPTSIQAIGDFYKNKRRGSYTLYIEILGQQGHTAYPQYTWNPEAILVDLLQDIQEFKKNLITDHDLSIFSINSSTHTSNIVPQSITVGINIRYFDVQIVEKLKILCDKYPCKIQSHPGALPYESSPTILKDALIKSIKNITGIVPIATTLGGTSDARFLNPITDEIIEFGLRSEYAHKVNEQVTKDELIQLTDIYKNAIQLLMKKNNTDP